ncbi:hypothetical protein RND71_028128 [Anisodus tanguticus]|uniref:Uncharacterized protein n=1 Tax=Anisodus tanguticus TaxID=243964 RepID=A0AAE1RHX6_9SOLA|nr:hypothetical protein RND71_028128 [Anisodus tanguticus]
MGSCISKCNPQRNPQEDDDHHHECVKDKLVISQAPISPKKFLPSSTIQQHSKLVSSSPSSSSSSCLVSLSSFSSTATNVTLSSSLSSSSSSSISSCFKDRSFSNDFLLSCAQEHDHILDIKKNKATNCVSHQNTSTMSTSVKKYSRSPSSTLSKPPSPRRECNSTTPKKRPRANSPAMVRQKSFRKEPDQQLIKGGNISNNTSNITYTYHHFPSTRTTLKSPSPSRRFPSNNLNGESSFRKSIASKGNNGSVVSRSSSLRRENHFTPKNEGKMRSAIPVSPKIDEMEIGEVKSSGQDLDSFLMEDINNPLIALDCFIFL